MQRKKLVFGEKGNLTTLQMEEEVVTEEEEEVPVLSAPARIETREMVRGVLRTVVRERLEQDGSREEMIKMAQELMNEVVREEVCKMAQEIARGFAENFAKGFAKGLMPPK